MKGIEQMAIITISRQFGSGGRTLGRMIAKRLDYLYLDETIIEKIAEKARVSKASVKSMERTAGGKLSKFFSIMLNQDYIFFSPLRSSKFIFPKR